MPVSYIWKWSVIHQWPGVVRFLRASACLIHPAEKQIDLRAGAMMADCQPTEQLTSRTRWVSQRQFQLLTLDSRLPFFNDKWLSCFNLNSPVFNFVCYNNWNEFPQLAMSSHRPHSTGLPVVKEHDCTTLEFYKLRSWFIIFGFWSEISKC